MRPHAALFLVFFVALSAACGLDHPIYNPPADAGTDLQAFDVPVDEADVTPPMDVVDVEDVVIVDAFDAGDVVDASDVPIVMDVTDVPEPDVVDAGVCGLAGQPCCGGGALTPCSEPELVCTAGVCVAAVTCDASTLTLCSGMCVDTSSSLGNCGACGTPCPATAPNTTERCTAGMCSATCTSGYLDCDHNPANGCEASTQTDPLNCGACAHTCAAPDNGTATCTGGTCGSVCNPGYVLTGGSCAVIPAPRLIAPLSTSTTTSRQPTFHWSLPSGASGAQIEICHDRACATVVMSFTATGTQMAPPSALAPGLYFWRASGVMGSAVGAIYSPGWEFVVCARTTPVDRSNGSFVDFNGDGYADVVVQSNLSANTYLYTGGATGVDTTPVTRFSGGPGVVASAGDVNGDGFADVVFGVPSTNSVTVYLGGPSGLAAMPSVTLPGAGTGNTLSVSGAGDVNGDGYADIVVGASASATALVYAGSAIGIVSTPMVTLTGTAGTHFGAAVAGGGDVNGDGFADLVIGAPAPGGAFVFLGSATGPATHGMSLAAPAGAGLFGGSVAVASDINGDGYADVVVGAYAGTTGTVYVAHGGSMGVGAPSLAASGAFGTGYSVSTGGDLNGDGFGDIAIGTFSDQALVLYGTGGAFAAPTVLADPTGVTNSSYAYGLGAVAMLGDTNRDGYADLAVNAVSAGVTAVYLGAATPVANPPTDILTGPPSVQFGISVASARVPTRLRLQDRLPRG